MDLDSDSLSYMLGSESKSKFDTERMCCIHPCKIPYEFKKKKRKRFEAESESTIKCEILEYIVG